jgi:hypothetical protein
MAALTGRSPRQMQRELDSLVYRNPEGRLGNRRPLFKRQRAAKLNRRSRGGHRSLLPAQRRCAESRAARRSAARRHQRPAGLLLDSGERRPRFIARRSTFPKRRHVSHSGAIATWALTLDSYAKIERQQHHDLWHAAGAATDLIEDALNGRTPTIYDQIDKDTRVVNQQETIAAREAQQKLKDASASGSGRTRTAPSGLPAITTTRSTICACAPMTART